MKAWVLDTNVIVSGFIKPHAPPAWLLAAFFGHRLRLVYDDRMIAEYAEVLARPEFGLRRNDWMGFLLFLRAHGQRVTPPALTLTLPDLDDLPFIETALATPAKRVVTRNLVHFQPAQALGLSILTPAEAWHDLD